MNYSKKMVALMSTLSVFVVYWYLRGVGFFIGGDPITDALYTTGVVIISSTIAWFVCKKLIKQGRSYDGKR